MIEKLIDKNDGVRRLDHFVKAHYKLTPKSHIYRMIRKGYIKVNGKKSKIFSRLKQGDVVVMPEPEKLSKHSVVISEARIRELKSSILREADDWLVINKPDNRAVHAGTGHITGLVDDYTQMLGYPVYLVHRLDRQTSGVMILAKNIRAKMLFDDMFKNRTVRKRYEMVTTKPKQNWSELLCDMPLERVSTADGSRSRVVPDGKAAKSVFTTLTVSGEYQIASASAHTGRFHQIRAHLSHLQHPILGDPWYHGEKSSLGLFLHASRIDFCWEDENIEVEACWPQHKLDWMLERGLYE